MFLNALLSVQRDFVASAGDSSEAESKAAFRDIFLDELSLFSDAVNDDDEVIQPPPTTGKYGHIFAKYDRLKVRGESSKTQRGRIRTHHAL
jgi:hypothetical protein